MDKDTLTQQELEALRRKVAQQSKSSIIAYLLWFFLGWLGAHKFYLAQYRTGIVFLLIGWSSILVPTALLSIPLPLIQRWPIPPFFDSILKIFVILLAYLKGEPNPLVIIGVFVFMAAVTIYCFWWLIDFFILHWAVRKFNKQVESEFLQGSKMGTGSFQKTSQSP